MIVPGSISPEDMARLRAAANTLIKADGALECATVDRQTAEQDLLKLICVEDGGLDIALPITMHGYVIDLDRKRMAKGLRLVVVEASEL